MAAPLLSTPSQPSTIFIILLFFCFNRVYSTDFDFQSLTLTNMKLLGDAHWSNDSIKLTRDLPVPNSGAGKILYSKPVRFRQLGSLNPVSFSTFFSFSVTNLNPSSIGGGFAFVISPDDTALGDAGGYIGIIDAEGVQTGVVAVEFDTLMDVQFNDINGNHVAVDINSVISTAVSNLDEIDVDLKSSNQINSWVEYSGSTRILNVSVSYSNEKPIEPILSVSLNLGEYVNDLMFVGFTGSTQGSTEIHSIDWWSFSSSFDGVVNPKSPLTSPPSPPPPPSPSTANLQTPSPVTDSNANSTPPTLAPSQSTTVQEKNSKCHNQFCKQGHGAVVGVVTGGAFFLALAALLLFWIYSKRFQKQVQGRSSEVLAKDVIKMPKEFSYRELKSATKGFDSLRIIGHGAFGTVYRGVLPDTGDIVAVKRCSHSGQGKEEFLSELSIIGTLRHRNLVKLQGWCHEKGEILLVYELLVNGSLDKALFESRIVLPWPHRQKILLGVASALAYLHQECENQVIHRDIKSSNIMLDESFNAKLGDFGLARQVEHDKTPDATVAAGTMGYLAPEYLLTGRATEKTDVFSYGAVVLEVASGRRPIEKEVNGVGKVGVGSNLVDWIWSLHREGRLIVASDPRLCGEFDEIDMRRVLLVGLACSHPDPLARPKMRGVVQMLAGEIQVPFVPTSKPSMSFSTSHLLLNLQDSVSDLNGMITFSSSSSSSSEQSIMPRGGGGSGGDVVDLVIV